jgi:molybdate transport system ATP-binding protein
MLLRCRIPLTTFELGIDASFDARVTSIFGPSGSGKTTLLEAIAGLRQVSSGEIEMAGRALFSSGRRINLTPQERCVGYVPQEVSLFPHLSVQKNILFGSSRRRPAGVMNGMGLEHVVDVLEIRPLLDRPVTKLSGGEAQRVALARAILSRPAVLLLDEPLAALDVGLKEKIIPYLRRVRDEFAIPIIYVTHDLTEVLSLADWVLMIRRGRLIAQGVPRELLGSSRALAQMEEDQIENVFNVAFVSSDAAQGTSRVRLESGQELFVPFVPKPSSRVFQVRVSADDILASTHRPEGISAANVLRGVIRTIETTAGQALLAVDAGDLFYVRLTASAVIRLGLASGSPVFLIIKARSFRPL